jgi:hypothetical protein
VKPRGWQPLPWASPFTLDPSTQRGDGSKSAIAYRQRRYLFLSLAAIVVLTVVASPAWLAWPHTAITRQNAGRIRRGMTRQEVEVILGGPPREEGGHYPVFGTAGLPWEEWATPDIVIFVTFDDNGRVAGMAAFHDDGLIDAIRRLLRL